VYLQQSGEGESERTHQLLLRSYVRLRRIAGTMMRGERIDHTLQPTALVHEAVLRVLRRQQGNFNDCSHYFYTVVREMRRVLIDSARKADAKAWERVATEVFHDAIATPAVDRLDMLALDEGLEQLERIDSTQAEVAHFRLFFGMNHSEIASMLSVSERTVERKWAVARSRLALVIDAGRMARGS